MAGHLIALAASVGEINTSDNLTMFGAFQKCMVVNGTKLKVVDFINTKLTCGALATPHKKGDVLTQTSGAVMIVDFTNTAKTAVYGYTTNGTFNATDSVSGSGSGSSFTPSVVTEPSPPHWYNWTVYQGNATLYGTMPTTAYLGCLYRGRCVLGADPARPYQWNMSRVADPFDWLYVPNDALSPIKGGNSLAGELGDILRAFIPYRDDYLIFGANSSMWVLRGDAAAGGVIDPISQSTGIFGAKSWCWGPDDILYWFGTGGVYASPSGLQPAELITAKRLPSIITTLAADPSTHRVIMTYDVIRQGIVFNITKLADGTSKNYWFDLRTSGFFPEKYPNECGPYSALHYDTPDPDLRGILLGCADGYIRTFDDAEKSDDAGITDEAIDAYVGIGPIRIASGEDTEGKLGQLDVTVGADSDDVLWMIYAEETAEETVAAMEALINPHTNGEITDDGHQQTLKPRVRGTYVGLVFRNNTVDESFSIETITGKTNTSKGR